MGVLGGYFYWKVVFGILIRTPEVPFLVLQPKWPIYINHKNIKNMVLCGGHLFKPFWRPPEALEWTQNGSPNCPWTIRVHFRVICPIYGPQELYFDLYKPSRNIRIWTGWRGGEGGGGKGQVSDVAESLVPFAGKILTPRGMHLNGFNIAQIGRWYLIFSNIFDMLESAADRNDFFASGNGKSWNGTFLL